MACREVHLLPPIIPDSSVRPRTPTWIHRQTVESAGLPGMWDGADGIGMGSSMVKSITLPPDGLVVGLSKRQW